MPTLSQSVNMSGEFDSVEKSLAKHLPPAELAEVRRILYGKELRYVVIKLSLFMYFLFSRKPFPNSADILLSGRHRLYTYTCVSVTMNIVCYEQAYFKYFVFLEVICILYLRYLVYYNQATCNFFFQKFAFSDGICFLIFFINMYPNFTHHSTKNIISLAGVTYSTVCHMSTVGYPQNPPQYLNCGGKLAFLVCKSAHETTAQLFSTQHLH